MPTAYNHLNTSMPPITITREIKRNTGAPCLRIVVVPSVENRGARR